MRSRTAASFWTHFDKLPPFVQRRARRAYALWRDDPSHPSLKFKRLYVDEDLWSIRVGPSWRALAVREGDVLTWFWIGSHADYDKLIG